MSITPKDGRGNPAILASYNKVAVPIKATQDGELCVNSSQRYELVKALRLDLSIKRDRELHKIQFDTITIINAESTLEIYIGCDNEDSKLTINQNVSISVSSNKIYFTNEPRNEIVEIWFFKIQE